MMIAKLNGKQHFKMYKSGKLWLIAGVTALSLGMAGVTVHADTTTTASAPTDTTATAVQSSGAATSGSTAVLSGGSAATSSASSATDPQSTATSASGATTSAASTATSSQPVTATPAADTTAATAASPATSATEADASDPVATPASSTAPADQATPAKAAVKMAAMQATPAAAQVATALAAGAVDPSVTDSTLLTAVMPNVKLQNLVLYNLQAQGINVQSVDQITVGMLRQLTSLVNALTVNGTYQYFEPVNGGNGQITNNPGNYSLEGLQYATGLTKLSLSGDLNYNEGYMRDDITDISPLAGLTNLTYIDLQYNRISDVTPISSKNLPNVTFLAVTNNCIADLSSLNAAQYTTPAGGNPAYYGFGYINQAVVFPMKNLTGNSYTLTAPFENKLPQNEPATNPVIHLPGVQAVTGGYLGATGIVESNPNNDNNYAKSQLQVFLYGAGTPPTLSAAGDLSANIAFNQLADQVTPGSTYNPFGSQYTVVPNPVTFYMYTSLTDDQTGNNAIFTYMIPYQTNQTEYTSSVTFIDETTNQPAVGVPDQAISGFVGDPITVTMPDPSKWEVDTAKTVLPPATISDSLQPVYTVYLTHKHVINDNAGTTTETVHYVVPAGVTAPADQVQSVTWTSDTDMVTGAVTYTPNTPGYPEVTTPTIPGYTPDKTSVPATTLTSGTTLPENTTVTVTYKQNDTGGGGNPTNPTNPTKPETPGDNGNTSGNTGAIKVGTVVYNIKKIYLYKNATFKKSQRKTDYAKKHRMNRSMFVVTAISRSAQGRLRYKVRDVNHLSKTYGMTGYITANTGYVIPVYYKTVHEEVTVINADGVNSYKKSNLTGKTKHYKQGTVLKVKRIVTHNLTTRFVLSDGSYITANKKLVFAGKHAIKKTATVKTVVNRYKTVNLTGKTGHYTKGHVFKLKGYAYSHPTNVHKGDTLRYKVAGGYITGNKKFVK